MSVDCGRRFVRPAKTALVLAAAAAAIFSTSAASAAVSDQEINAAVERAVNFLRLRLPSLEGGRASLATLALLKAGVSPDTPELKAALDRIAARVTTDKGFAFTGDFNYDFTPGLDNDHYIELSIVKSLTPMVSLNVQRIIPTFEPESVNQFGVRLTF